MVVFYWSLTLSLKETRPANLSLSAPGAMVLETTTHSTATSWFIVRFMNFTATKGCV